MTWGDKEPDHWGHERRGGSGVQGHPDAPGADRTDEVNEAAGLRSAAGRADGTPPSIHGHGGERKSRERKPGREREPASAQVTCELSTRLSGLRVTCSGSLGDEGQQEGGSRGREIATVPLYADDADPARKEGWGP